MRSARVSQISVVLVLCGLVSAAAFADRSCPPESALHQYVRELRERMPERAAASGPTTGIEVEGMVPNQIGISGSKDHLVRFLEGRGWRVTVEEPSGLHFVVGATNASGRRLSWQVHLDGSIDAERFGQTAVEISSPVLTSAEDLNLFLDAMGSLRSIGMRSEPLSAGVHIHVGLPDPTPELIRDLHLIMARVGDSMASAFSQASSRRRFATVVNHLEAEVLESVDRQGWLKLLLEKNLALRLRALQDHGTVEFRIFNSTLNRDAIALMERFCRELVGAVRNQDPRVVALLERRGQQVEFSELARALGFERAEYQNTLSQLRRELMASEMLVPNSSAPSPLTPVVTAAVLMGAFSRQLLAGERQGAGQ